MVVAFGQKTIDDLRAAAEKREIAEVERTIRERPAKG
jgi:hypothetical protein